MTRPHYATSPGSDADKYPDFFASSPSIHDLAVQQGVAPVRNLADFRADFWPDSERVEDFITTVRQWRHEGG